MEYAALGAAAASSELFDYNRKGYFFDKELRTTRLYQSQEMNVRQFELYREDVRDLVDLTVGKMENYLIVNTLQLGFTIAVFVEGRPEPEAWTKPWMVCLLMICNVGAFMYFLLSIWLSMHASVAAHSFGVRLLTQFVRLPVPDERQLDEARALSSEYEGSSAKQMLRVPLFKQQLRKLVSTMDDVAFCADGSALDAADSAPLEPFEDGHLSPVAMLQHVRLFRRLQANWQSYDAYARVCMAMGTNQLLHTYSYYCLGILVGPHHMPWPAFSCVIILTTCAWIIARLDLYLSTRILVVAAALLVLPPLLTTASLAITLQYGARVPELEAVARFLVPCVFALHVLWLVFSVLVARAEDCGEVSLPKKFRSVLYLDVFGWLSAPCETSGEPTHGAVPRRTQEFASHFSPVGEEGLSSGLKTIMAEESLRLQNELSADLGRWESREVGELSDVGQGEGDMFIRELAALRVRFDAAVLDISEQLVETVGDVASSAAASGSEMEVWLKLEYNPYDTPMEFYYNCESKETCWEVPKGDVRISDMQALERNIAMLEEQVLALCGGFQRAPSSSANTVAADSAAQNRLSRSAVLQTAAAWLEDAPHDQQEQVQFGGREAVRVDPAGRVRGNQSAGVSHSAGAGATFHPSTRQGAAESVYQRRPGQLPWDTVLQGSLMLISVWLAAFGYSVYASIYKTDFFGRYEAPAARDRLDHASPLRAEPVAVPEWPHPFMRPVGLACHAAYGDTMMLAERYAVHELTLGAGFAPVTVARSRAIAACLNAVPGAQGRGIAGIDIQCLEPGGNCTALVLSADGRSALQCALESPALSVPRATRRSSRPLALPGGVWRAAAHASGTATTGSAVWAAGAEAVVLLAPPVGRPAGPLAPRLELARGVEAANITQLVELRGRVLLGLGADGILRAWPLAGGQPIFWQLQGNVRWGGGLCLTTDEAAPYLYLAGLTAGDDRAVTKAARPGLWRTALPAELTRLLGLSGESGVMATGW